MCSSPAPSARSSCGSTLPMATSCCSPGDVPHVARRGLAVEPMTCPPNAFQTGDALIRLEPGAGVSASWGIRPGRRLVSGHDRGRAGHRSQPGARVPRETPPPGRAARPRKVEAAAVVGLQDTPPGHRGARSRGARGGGARGARRARARAEHPRRAAGRRQARPRGVHRRARAAGRGGRQGADRQRLEEPRRHLGDGGARPGERGRPRRAWRRPAPARRLPPGAARAPAA